MAKLIQCPFCGKEINASIRSDESEQLYVGDMVKLTDVDLANMILTYLSEEDEYINKNGHKKLDYFRHFYCFNDEGYFTVREFLNSTFIESDISARAMVASKVASEIVDTAPFTKDDITKLEYRFTSKLGDPVGLVSFAFSVEIRLNDEKVLTYKPCITRLAVIGRGITPYFTRRSAEKKVKAALEDFKRATGCTLPIVKVRKFK